VLAERLDPVALAERLDPAALLEHLDPAAHPGRADRPDRAAPAAARPYRMPAPQAALWPQRDPRRPR
jgi:hypothetical protein